MPADVEAPTGGNRYDLALAGSMRALGAAVEVRRAPGRWPVGEPRDRRRLAGLMGTGRVLVDGLVAAGAPEAVEGATAAGARVHVLVHLPLALETGLAHERARELDALERRALHAAAGVIVPSRWTAEDIAARHGVTAAVVARPGTQPAPLARGSSPPRLLHLASVTPRKDQLGAVAALARLRDLPWTARLVGSLEADPAYAARVSGAVAERGLSPRVAVTGPLEGAALESEWAAADLLVLPSRVEPFGMVVTEALARGIPAVVAEGTGAQEALGAAGDGVLPGAVVPAGDPAALAAALRRLLTDEEARPRARTAAAARRAALTGWATTARRVLRAVGCASGSATGVGG